MNNPEPLPNPFRLLLEAADVAGWSFDPQQGTLSWNKAMCRLHDRTEAPSNFEEWSYLAGGEPVFAELLRPQDWPDSLHQFRYPGFGSTVGTVQLSAVYEPSVHCVHGVATFQPGVREDLPKALLHQILEHVDVGIALSTVDQPYHLNYVNQAFLEMTGYAQEEVVGRDVRMLHGRDVQQPAQSGIKQSFDTGLEGGAVLRNYRKDGSPFYNEVRVFPLLDGGGKVHHFLSTQRDVSRQKALEFQSVRHQTLFQMVFQQATVGMALFKEDEKPFLINPALVAFLGRPEAEIYDLPIRAWGDGDPEGGTGLLPFPQEGDQNAASPIIKSFKQPNGSVVWGRETRTQVHVDDEGEACPYLLVILEDITESKRMLTQKKTVEQELKAMSTRLALAIQPAQIGIWDYDLTNGNLHWDDRMFQLYGVTRDQFSGAYDAWTRGVHPDDLKAAEASLNAAIEGRGVFDTVFRVRYPNGEARHMKADAMVLKNEEGRATRMIGTNYDITDRINTEKDLRYQNALLEAQQDASPAGMLIVHLPHGAGRCQWNRRFLDIWDLEESDLDPDETQALYSILKAKIQNVQLYEDRLFRIDNTVWSLDFELKHDVSIEIYGQPVLDQGTDPLGYVWFFFDVSVRKAAETRLRDALAESSRLVRLMQGREQRILELKSELNRTAARFGEAQPYLIDNELTPHSEDEQAGVLPRGLKEWLENLREMGGEFHNALSIAEDLEIQKQRAAKLADRAEKASRAKSNFLANMSHEIRTPLNAVIGIAELLSDSSLNKYQRDMLQKLDSSARTLLSIINDILDFSKIEANQIEVEKEPFDLVELLENLAGMTATRDGGDKLEILFDIPHGLNRFLRGDSLRLSQVLINLLGNAIKFTERGHVVLSVRQETCDDDRVTFVFEVGDTGIGMSEDQMARLFLPFTQADASMTRRFGGTGLGLSICKSLAELMGGGIEVESRLGEGSTFRVRIPMDICGSRTLCGLEQLSLPSMSVLLAERGSESGQLFARTLRDMGVAVQWERSGRTALQALRARCREGAAFDVVLLDWDLTDIDGLQVFQQIQRMTWQGKPPATVMITAHNRERLLSLSKSSVIHDVLVKPVTPMVLLRVLRSVVGLAHPSPVANKAPLEALRGVRILLVEDVLVNREVASALLKRAGASVTVAVDGRNAVETTMADPKAFDVILMDVHMPVMDGFAATAEIQTRLGVSAPPIVALTAKAFREDRRQAMSAGMTDYLTKPIQIKKVIEVLQRVVPSAPAPPTAPPIKVLATAPKTADFTAQPRFNEVLETLGGDRSFFRRQLTLFRESHADVLDRTKAVLKDADWDEAVNLVHAAKGAAANLGGVATAESFARLEHALRRKQVPPSLLEETEQTFTEFLKAAHTWQVENPEAVSTEPQATEPQPPPNPAEWKPLLERLLLLLDQSDMEALSVWGELKPLIVSHWGADVCDPVTASLDRLDFPTAVTLLSAQSSK